MPSEWVSTFKLSVCVCVGAGIFVCLRGCLCVYWCAARLGQVCLEVNYLGTRPSHPSSLTAPRWDAHKYATLYRGGVMKTNFAHCKSQSRARHKIFNNNYSAKIKKRAHTFLNQRGQSWSQSRSRSRSGGQSWSLCTVKSFNFWLIARTWQIAGCCCTRRTPRIIVFFLFGF